MVYRGKPSAGCENCRKAKKRCGLEKPACLRCVKLNKSCLGYRDTTALQIQDESESVRLKADRRQALRAFSPAQGSKEGADHDALTIHSSSSAFTPHSDYSFGTPSDGTIDLLPSSDLLDFDRMEIILDEFEFWNQDVVNSSTYQKDDSLPMIMTPSAVDVATTYFYNQFASAPGHWMFLKQLAQQDEIGPLVSLAIRACGMAALNNSQATINVLDYARAFYADALSELNAALRDPKKCRTDDSLVAVSMLGYYENLTCDSRQSVSSWKAHVQGALQLLKLRGKPQLKRNIGRMLFREVRSQTLIYCTWDDIEPPAFLKEWNGDLAELEPNDPIRPTADELALICFDFAVVRSKIRYHNISDTDAMEQLSQIEMQMIEWAATNMKNHEFWQYYDVEVPDSPHIWNGTIHGYRAGSSVGVAWNTYRNIRIMLSRTQEMLCSRFQMNSSERSEQMAYFRSVRRQMTDEICSAIPAQLGTAPEPYNSPCVIITAYASIWPLFFAGTCALERVGKEVSQGLLQGKFQSFEQTTSAPAAQAAWVIGRLHYISDTVGLKWADGVAAILKGDFGVYDKTFRQFHVPEWARQIIESGRGPKILIEKESPLSDVLNRPRSDFGPMWLGREHLGSREVKWNAPYQNGTPS